MSQQKSCAFFFFPSEFCLGKIFEARGREKDGNKGQRSTMLVMLENSCGAGDKCLWGGGGGGVVHNDL